MEDFSNNNNNNNNNSSNNSSSNNANNNIYNNNNNSNNANNNIYNSNNNHPGRVFTGHPIFIPSSSSANHSTPTSASSLFSTSRSYMQPNAALTSSIKHSRLGTPRSLSGPSSSILSLAGEKLSYEEIIRRNDEYFARVISSQLDTFQALASMNDALSSKLSESAKSSQEFIDEILKLEELIDTERRKWKQNSEVDKMTY